ncbi:MAG: intracellular protease/amidase [Clostridiales bacterium]|nr:intracellular protease/amidase [Clostridiales bacterium]
MDKILEGKKVAVLIETEYIAKEAAYYKDFFTSHGAKVEFMTYLLGKPERVIVSDVTEVNQEVQSMVVKKEIADCNPNDYAIVLTAANYVACRLREIPPMGSLGDVSLLRSPAAVRFMAGAMMNPQIVKGALCHALWILTPVPELLKGRKVICHTVVLADVVNAGGIYVPDESHVVVDKDLVTGRSAEDLEVYCESLLATFCKINASI